MNVKKLTLKLILPVVFILSISLIGCTNGDDEDDDTEPTTQESSTNDVEEDDGATTFTVEEVAKHNNKEDCWMIFEGAVYDATDYISQHPGGDKLLDGCGKEATDLFETRPTGSGTPHSDNARDIREDFFLGDIE